MSTLTRCNFCTEQRIRRAAVARGAHVFVYRVQYGEMQGWLAVQAEDVKNPSAYFKELTDHCVC